MSRSTVSVTYNFNLSLTRGDVAESGYPVFTTGCGMTDELAIGMANAFIAQPWPSGVVAQAWITRHETDEIQSEADLTAGTFG